MISCMSDLKYGNGIEATNNRSAFAHVAKDQDMNKFYFEINESCYLLFDIKYCPICGRKLTEDNND